MEAIDWSKPIELMNGEPRKHEVREDSRLVWISEILTAGFFVDCQGCIGGVQVVRNRKEPVKHLYYVLWHDADMGVAVYRSSQAPISGREQFAKILVWRDENGRTRVEVCDE